MAGMNIRVHPASIFKFQPLEQLAGALDLKAQMPPGPNGQQSELDLRGLAFVDPDGETHVYVFTDEGRQKLVRELTGGIVVGL